MKTLIFSLVVFAFVSGVQCAEYCALQDSWCADCLGAQKNPDVRPHFEANPPNFPVPLEFSEVTGYSAIARNGCNPPFKYRNGRPHTGRSIVISKSSWLK